MKKLNLKDAQKVADKIQSGVVYSFEDYQGYLEYYSFNQEKDIFFVEVYSYDFETNQRYIVSEKHYPNNDFISFLLIKPALNFKNFLND